MKKVQYYYKTEGTITICKNINQFYTLYPQLNNISNYDV